MSTIESISPDKVFYTSPSSKIMNDFASISKKNSTSSESCVTSTSHAITKTSSAIGHAWKVTVDTTSSKIKQVWTTTATTASSVMDTVLEEIVTSFQRVPVRDRAWVFKASFNKIATMIQGEQEDPTLATRQKIQDAIEGVFVKEHADLIKNNEKFLNKLLPNGELPLNHAINLKNKELVQLLLENKADPQKANRKGKNALTAVMLAEHKEIKDLLFNALLPMVMSNEFQELLKNPEFQASFMEAQKQGPKGIAALQQKLMTISKQQLEIIFEESRYAPHNDELASSIQDYLIFSAAATILILDYIGYGDGSIASAAAVLGSFIQMSSLATLIHEMVREPQISGLLTLSLIITKQMTNSWFGTISQWTINAMYGASIIETAKTIFSNMKTRPGASLRRLTVDSINTYALGAKIFDRPAKNAMIKLLVETIFGLPGKPKETNFTSQEDCNTEYKNLYGYIKSGFNKFFGFQLTDVIDPQNPNKTIRTPIETSDMLTSFNGLFDQRLDQLIEQQCARLPKEPIIV